MSDQLVTTAQVKAQNGIPDATDDAVISAFIDEVSAWIEGYTSRKFVAEASATYVFDTQAGYVLRVPRGIRAVTSMGVNNSAHQPDSGGSYTTVAAHDILLRPKAEANDVGWPFMEVRISRNPTGSITAFGSIENGCTITGDFGFATVPLDIQGVTIDAVIAAYQSRSDGASSTIGADDISIAPWRDFFMRGSPQRKILDSYRHWGLA